MLRKYLLPAMAVAGVLFAIYSVRASSKPAVVPEPTVRPAQAPFASYIAGAGIIEASTENIAVGAGIPGIVKRVFVKGDSRIKVGDPLFSIDDRELLAEQLVRRRALENAKARYARLEGLPRREDVPPAMARVKEAETNLAEASASLGLAESVTDRRAISVEELNRRRYAVAAAEEKLAEMRAQLCLLEAGAWPPDLRIAAAEIAASEAQLKATAVAIERLTVRSPIAGQVLQVNVRPGEYAPSGVLSKPLMLIGSLERLHVRVDVDENDAWRFRAGARALAFVRGNPGMKASLRHEKTEPYVIPKRSLTGDSTERVDTRVMQVIYSFDRSQLPVYAGQLMDVVIEAQPLTASAAPQSVAATGNGTK